MSMLVCAHQDPSTQLSKVQRNVNILCCLCLCDHTLIPVHRNAKQLATTLLSAVVRAMIICNEKWQ